MKRLIKYHLGFNVLLLFQGSSKSKRWICSIWSASRIATFQTLRQRTRTCRHMIEDHPLIGNKYRRLLFIIISRKRRTMRSLELVHLREMEQMFHISLTIGSSSMKYTRVSFNVCRSNVALHCGWIDSSMKVIVANLSAILPFFHSIEFWL